jgi:hypothetical protein
MSSLVGRSNTLMKSSIVGALALIIIIPMFSFGITGISQVRPAYAETVVYNIEELLVGGSATCDNSDGFYCDIPAGVTVNITGVTFEPHLDYLFIDGPVIIDNGGRISNSFTHLSFRGPINITDGSSIEHRYYTFSSSGIVRIDNTSSILNDLLSPEMVFSGPVYNDGTIRNACGSTFIGYANILGNPVIEDCPPIVLDPLIDVKTECESLPLTGGAASYADTGGDGFFCEIPAGATLNLADGQTLLFAGIGLFNYGEIILSGGSQMIADDGWGIQNYGLISITDGSTLLMKPLGYFDVMGTVNVDSASFVTNQGFIIGSGVYNDGTFYNDCTGSIALGPINGNQPIDICGDTTEVLADATNQATGQSMYAASRTFYGERFAAGSEVVGEAVECVTVELRKHGSPTSTAQIGLYTTSITPNNVNKAPVLKWEYGTIDVSTLTTGYKAYEFCNAGSIVFEDNAIGVQYLGGDEINRIDVRRSNTGAGPDFDGLASHHVNYDGKWYVYNTEGNSRDLLFKLTN